MNKVLTFFICGVLLMSVGCASSNWWDEPQYRCPEHPKERDKAATGTHALGLAADYGVSFEKAAKLDEGMSKHPRITGKGVNQKGKHRFMHQDSAGDEPWRPRPHIWSY